MEVPVINRISDFETAGITPLNYPPFNSRHYLLSGIQKIYETHSFFKLGALILALIASLSTIINKLKTFITGFRRHHSLPSQPILYDTDFDTDTDSSSDDEPEYEEPSIASRTWRQVDEDFRVRESESGHLVGDEWRKSYFTIPNRGSSEELSGGKSVVKLWDNLKFGFGVESKDALNVYDANKGTNAASIFGGKDGFEAISAPLSSPAVIISAGVDSLSGRAAVGAWDTRLRCREPAIVAEWRPQQSVEKIVAINSDGVEKLYIRGDVTGKLATGGDLRKVMSPLRNLTKCECDIRWDADSGIVSEERVDDST
ncbi:hypothetical protein J1N35_028857 [Gossypium stocksii]|uniref:Uncharacterized protein n=1 Tax=Gossypium stocksii TaxID=47602 RepID=A0A9D3UWT6_9ROSI|nr:hypothetical protein J1N35_028857 [Gossypium stocksii]